MRRGDEELKDRLGAALVAFDRQRHRLPGIDNVDRRRVLLEQLVESMHRIRYVEVIRRRRLSPLRADPRSDLFHPLKAAILAQRGGNIEEAYWLVFLFVHFGKNRKGGWRYAREVYGRLGNVDRWDWSNTSANPSAFRQWLFRNEHHLRRDNAPGGFGNHRKFESLRQTAATVESYVEWVRPPRTHEQLMTSVLEEAKGDAQLAFHILYGLMRSVYRFGRLARFDYLSMVGKLGLAPIRAGSAYLVDNATGPINGTRLLFGSCDSARSLDALLVELDGYLGVGMQVLEDALCNWQKSPDEFTPFRT